MRALALALLVPAAAAQTPLASRCDAAVPMPEAVAAVPGAAETARELSGPEPVAMPNWCAPPAVAVRGERWLGLPPARAPRPPSGATVDQLRLRYDTFRDALRPGRLPLPD